MQKRKVAPQIAEMPLAPLYRVIFDTCGPFVAGEVAHPSALGDEKGLAYLLRIGAVVPIDSTATGADA